MNYEFVVKQKKIKEMREGKLITSEKTFLCVKDKETGLLYPHPLSNFIKNELERKSLAPTTQKNYAEEIKKFLHFILECIENEDEIFLHLEEEGIPGLELQHGANYISFLTHRVKLGQLQPTQVYRTERILVRLYRWLNEQKITKETVKYREDIRNINGARVLTTISPFDNLELGTEYPNRRESTQRIKDRRLHDFGNGRLDLVNLFIRVAELEASDIALGVAFQCYGGLRRGEVVNLLRSSVKEPNKNGSGDFTINIQDNWRILFPSKELMVSEQVKKERIQAIFKVPIVLELYEKHKENLLRLERKGKIKNKHALFCSIHTGRPITGMAYWERFTKVKNKFLDILLETNEKDYQFLTSKSWSTHIGRGIYTNMLVFLLGWSASEVAIARGDSNIQSAQSYIEEQNVKKQTEEAIEILSRATIQAGNKKYMKIEDLRSF
ncbi:hypothetical protein D1953_10835 [Peribacillus asahii]|uniref:Core-binding (CB) domain-containing protein n=1 Tax=Peribacillus asahii TaxID=228899 RepID=A0A398B6Y2_9BACI|nr:hypothetical protein [Peribacillus asahii]RID85311.1 hypothetical protein D1953_10835 [Peribacillus asahii]USK59395.1 hypothetical protein LIT37_19845 [Peribacillus asahii]